MTQATNRAAGGVSGQYETSAGLVRWTEWGRGPTVVLLHANPGSGADFGEVVGPLADGQRVVAVDWPGFGASGPVAAGFRGAPSYADALVELLDHWSGQDGWSPAVLVGNSVGGYAALVAAARRPSLVRALVLVAPGGFTAFNAATRAFCSAMGTERLARRLVVPLAYAYLRRRTPASRAALAAARRVRVEPAARRAFAAVWRSFLDADHDLRDVPPPGCPVLLTWGRFDPVLPALLDGRRAARTLGVPLHSFATGHEPHAEAPDEWLAVVEPFLAAHVASAVSSGTESSGG